MTEKQPSDRAEDILAAVADVIEARRGYDSGRSYVARLLRGGREAVLKKMGEEAVETLLAAAAGDPERVVYETADLWFHTLVMLAEQGLRPERVLAELQRRFGVSGLHEQAARDGRAPGS